MYLSHGKWSNDNVTIKKHLHLKRSCMLSETLPPVGTKPRTQHLVKTDTEKGSNCHLIIIYPLTARVTGAPQVISQPVSSIFPFSTASLGLGELQDRPFPDVVFPPLPLSILSSSTFTVPCKIVLARPDERETCPYNCNLHLFTMVRSSCGPTACWILAQISSLVTMSLYEISSI